MITEGIALGSVVDIVFYPTRKNNEVILMILLFEGIGPAGCDEGFLTIIGFE